MGFLVTTFIEMSIYTNLDHDEGETHGICIGLIFGNGNEKNIDDGDFVSFSDL